VDLKTAYGRCNPWSNQWDNFLSYVYNLAAIITAFNVIGKTAYYTWRCKTGSCAMSCPMSLESPESLDEDTIEG
jgi:hypothetical protein